jgi:hypothetical protein
MIEKGTKVICHDVDYFCKEGTYLGTIWEQDLGIVATSCPYLVEFDDGKKAYVGMIVEITND